ncbi:MAG: type IX secretion system membrane protein PorP/SprF, partial [Flavobacteriaceae bacterium]|nr:type IX secretion system membrane protein PorP/SprF [Flavobacteriaceae bacterium]
YYWKINRKLAFKPTFLVKYTNGAPVSVDLTSNFYLNEQIWLGAFYRVGDGVGALVNFKISDVINIGYSFDYITSDLNPYANGSHEVMLGFDLPFPQPKCNCVDLHN